MEGETAILSPTTSRQLVVIMESEKTARIPMVSTMTASTLTYQNANIREDGSSARNAMWSEIRESLFSYVNTNLYYLLQLVLQ